MKQQMQALLRKEITKQQNIRTEFKKGVKFYMVESVKPNDGAFQSLNIFRTELRKVESKLAKLREVQKSLNKVDGFLCSGQIFDSQMKVTEVTWE